MSVAEQIGLLLGAALQAGTPVLLATLGEVVAERAGIINLGLEGAMLLGAMSAAWVDALTGQPLLAGLAGALAGGGLGLAHAALVVWARLGMLAAGLCLFFVARGLSALWGHELVGRSLVGLSPVHIPYLSDLPLLGEALFRRDGMVYVAAALAILCFLGLFHSRAGLLLRACGEDAAVAQAEGVPVAGLRTLAVTAGGLLAGLGGAHIVLGFSRSWTEGVSAGRGWVAVGMVVLCRWNPLYALPAAYLFGGIASLQLNAQAAGWYISPDFLSMLPYLFTILALSAIQLLLRNNSMPQELAQGGD